MVLHLWKQNWHLTCRLPERGRKGWLDFPGSGGNKISLLHGLLRHNGKEGHLLGSILVA